MTQPKSYQTQTETESETDVDALKAILRQKEQLDAHKAKGSDAGKKGNCMKRFTTMWFIFTWYILPLHANGFIFVANMGVYAIKVVGEMGNVWRDKQKDKINYSAVVM